MEEKQQKTEVTGQQNGLAIAAMVVGIVSLTLGWVPFGGLVLGITAIVLGIVSMKKTHNKGMSITGIVTGSLATLWSLVITGMMILAMLALGGIAVQGSTIATELNKATDNFNKTQQTMIDAKKDFSKGSTAVFGKFEVKVNSVQRDYVPADEYNRASEGMELVVVNVSVKNVSDSSESFYAYDLSLNVNGIADTMSYIVVTPEFKGGNISKDATATGNVVYEVTKGATNLKLQHEETILDIQNSGVKTLTYTLEI